MSPEFPTADPQMWFEIMAKPIRYRQLTIWDWQLPEDDSLEIYRQNLRTVRARRRQAAPCRYGHTSGRYANGDCKECRRIGDNVEYRTARGIPLDAPLMTPSEAGRRGGLTRASCPHGPDTERDRWGHCRTCRKERDQSRYHARKESAA